MQINILLYLAIFKCPDEWHSDSSQRVVFQIMVGDHQHVHQAIDGIQNCQVLLLPTALAQNRIQFNCISRK